MRTRIKICGLTREADIDAAVQEGADAVGFVFYHLSKRCLTPQRAAQLRAAVPAFVDVVALFVNPDEALVREIQEIVRPDILQFHGDESPEDCAKFSHRFLKAFRVGAPGLDTAQGVALACASYEAASGWLFDSYSPQFGGSGRGFDRILLAAVSASVSARPMILSGGLNIDSITETVKAIRPWAVDVSSGVETSPGVKSTDKIRAFVRGVSDADCQPRYV